MTELNLDRSKQYATDYSNDGGRTWAALGGNDCAAMVIAEALYADEQGLPVAVNGPVVTITDVDGMYRKTPTS